MRLSPTKPHTVQCGHTKGHHTHKELRTRLPGLEPRKRPCLRFLRCTWNEKSCSKVLLVSKGMARNLEPAWEATVRSTYSIWALPWHPSTWAVASSTTGHNPAWLPLKVRWGVLQEDHMWVGEGPEVNRTHWFVKRHTPAACFSPSSGHPTLAVSSRRGTPSSCDD